MLALSICSQDLPRGADSLLRYGDYLLQSGDYYRAVSEYKRCLFFHAGTAEADSACIGVGRALLLADQFSLLEQWIQEMPDGCPLRPASSLIAAQGAIEAGLPAVALRDLDLCHTTTGDGRLAERSYLRGLALVESGSYGEASGAFSMVPDSSPFSTRACQYGDLLEHAPDLEPRSPTVAALLGVVPGLGYAYANHYGTAIASLIVNGALAVATISAFQSGHDETGWALGVLGLGFYMGNITGSAQSANRYNRFVNERFQEQFVF